MGKSKERLEIDKRWRLILIVGSILLVSFLGYRLLNLDKYRSTQEVRTNQSQPQNPPYEEQANTSECNEGHSVEVCWDNSEVRRVPPSCSFAPCPTLPDPDEWREYRNDKFRYSIKYPWEKTTSFWQPEPVDLEGIEVVHLLNSCAIVSATPNQLVTQKSQDNALLFAFSPQVKALGVGKSVELSERSPDDSVVKYVYQRLPDAKIGGRNWRAYQVSNSWEMHAAEVQYAQTIGDTSFILVERKGGVCPNVGPTEVIESFEYATIHP